ncbi:MAG: L-ribulose-5-phosphate 4-epimerase [Clostridia bacterium]|nr:L-ribulose-5-phosphate 4-epimerase [Clostridia bacterium]
MLETLKRKVCAANIELQTKGLITYTWGNVSGIDRKQNLVVIKPSGVSYDELTYDKMVVVDLDGNKIEGDLSPSSDTATHLELYKKYPEIGGITHTHSNNATSWAQAGRDIPFFGTTHADYFHGDIPCTRMLTAEEINGEYEKNTGLVIIETLDNNNIDPVEMPAILCRSHGPFTWGKDADEAVHNAVVLEEVAEMALKTLILSPNTESAPQVLSDKHYFRKHGANAYYGQK